ncbi:hypothetical protein KW843_07555 [Acidovorax sp. sif1233]|uniref:DUF7673 family protein n=1 Tax=Acidovorax sp. sif1233 TaxID=2854792 RepID=UPI001C485228|nr:hypothetical protein [Acidovorax sp. sif1233]MBV7454322.1 hypothetical protein [Acidovorax sp. sif1233]
MNDLLTNPSETTMLNPAEMLAARRAAENRRLLGQFDEEELEAVRGLFNVARRLWDTGGGGTVARLLLGIYNGGRFPFDLTDLRRLDGKNLAMAMTVLHMDASYCRAEVHVVLAALLDDPTVQSRMECWAYDMGLKGRAKKAEVEELRRRLAR